MPVIGDAFFAAAKTADSLSGIVLRLSAAQQGAQDKLF
jgi:hypothetical protein